MLTLEKSKQEVTQQNAVAYLCKKSNYIMSERSLLSFKLMNLGIGIQKKCSLLEGIIFLLRKTYEKAQSIIFKPEFKSKCWFYLYRWGREILLNLRKATFLFSFILIFWKHDSEYCMHTTCQLALTLGTSGRVRVITAVSQNVINECVQLGTSFFSPFLCACQWCDICL